MVCTEADFKDQVNCFPRPVGSAGLDRLQLLHQMLAHQLGHLRGWLRIYMPAAIAGKDIEASPHVRHMVLNA
jgi:hypothetical protein